MRSFRQLLAAMTTFALIALIGVGLAGSVSATVSTSSNSLTSQARGLAARFMERHFRAGSFTLYGEHISCAGSSSMQSCLFAGSLQNVNISATVNERLEQGSVLLTARGTAVDPMAPSQVGHFNFSERVRISQRRRSPASNGCVAKRLDAATTRAWARAWERKRQLGNLRVYLGHDDGPLFGSCGSTEWGLGYFEPDAGQRLTMEQQVNEQDGPDAFRRVKDGSWQDIASSVFLTLCSPPYRYPIGFPRALVKAWHRSCAS